MPKQNKTKPLSEVVLRALDKPLHPIYLEMEASEAETVHCEVADVVLSLLNKQRVRDREVMVRKWEESTMLEFKKYLYPLKSYKLKKK